MRDRLISFSIKDSDLVGKMIMAKNSLINSDRSLKYPETINKLLSELRVVVSLIGISLKHNGGINIVLQSNKYFNFMTADYFNNGFVRSYATLKEFEDIPDDLPFSELMSEAKLMITINYDNNHHYQGIVDVSGKDNLSEAVEKYFNESAQIPTYIRIMTDINETDDLKIWAIMIQNIRIRENDFDLEDRTWKEIGLSLGVSNFEQVIEKDESIESNLEELFGKYGLDIYEEKYVEFGCKCSEKKFQEIFNAMSVEDIKELQVKNMIEINCEFCGKNMAFSSKIH